jgi:hypothetical protein
MQKISLSIKTFNERVKLMNQTGSKQISLTAQEARNLHNDIFNLLANLAELQTNLEIINSSSQGTSLNFDGGSF